MPSAVERSVIQDKFIDKVCKNTNLYHRLIAKGYHQHFHHKLPTKKCLHHLYKALHVSNYIRKLALEIIPFTLSMVWLNIGIIVLILTRTRPRSAGSVNFDILRANPWKNGTII